MNFFLEPHILVKKIIVKLDLSNYAKKTDTAGFDTSKFAKKVDLVSLKSNADKLDIDKLENTPADLGKLINVVENDAVKKTVYNELVKNLMLFRLMMLVMILVIKLTMIQKLKILKREYLTMINILLLMTFINFQVEYLMND